MIPAQEDMPWYIPHPGTASRVTLPSSSMGPFQRFKRIFFFLAYSFFFMKVRCGKATSAARLALAFTCLPVVITFSRTKTNSAMFWLKTRSLWFPDRTLKKAGCSAKSSRCKWNIVKFTCKRLSLGECVNSNQFLSIRSKGKGKEMGKRSGKRSFGRNGKIASFPFDLLLKFQK